MQHHHRITLLLIVMGLVVGLQQGPKLKRLKKWSLPCT